MPATSSAADKDIFHIEWGEGFGSIKHVEREHSFSFYLQNRRNEMEEYREGFAADFEDILRLSRDIVDDFFRQHGDFRTENQDTIKSVLQEYGQKPMRFRNVVRKYFLNVTFDYRRIPWRYVLPVFSFYAHKKLNKNYRKLVHIYSQDMVARLVEMRRLKPDLIGSEADFAQVVKLTLATCIQCYIHLPFLKGRNSWNRLHTAYVAGFYLGVAYLISEGILDRWECDDSEREALHVELLRMLRDPAHYSGNNALLEFVASRIAHELPPDRFFQEYSLLYALQSTQFLDRKFVFRTYGVDEIRERATLLALKSHLSLFAIHAFSKRSNLTDSLRQHLLYSFLVQIDDDLRDAAKDRAEGIRTFFSEPWRESTFAPHAMYLALVDSLCARYPHLSWLYMDYAHTCLKEGHEQSLDHVKLVTFVQKTLHLNLSTLYGQLTPGST
jgi:hypothetical protein